MSREHSNFLCVYTHSRGEHRGFSKAVLTKVNLSVLKNPPNIATNNTESVTPTKHQINKKLYRRTISPGDLRG